MSELIDSFEGRCFRAALYDNDNQDAAGMHSHEVILTRKTHPRDSVVLDAGYSEPCELVEAAAWLVSLRGNWDQGAARWESSEGSFETEILRDVPVRLVHLHFYEKTPGEAEPRWIPVFGPDEAEDLLAVAKLLAARHSELNLLRRGFDPDHELILTVAHGRFHAELFEYVHVLSNGETHWPTYSAALYADGKILWAPGSGSRASRLLDLLTEGGKDRLNNYLTARGLPLAGKNDLLDFQKTLVETDLRSRAFWEQGSHRWYERNKDRLGQPVGEVTQPKPWMDFRVEELGEEKWRFTPLSAQAQQFIEHSGVKHGWRQGPGDECLLDSSFAALGLMRDLTSRGYRLENHWLDPRRELVRERATEQVSERDSSATENSHSTTDYTKEEVARADQRVQREPRMAHREETAKQETNQTQPTEAQPYTSADHRVDFEPCLEQVTEHHDRESRGAGESDLNAPSPDLGEALREVEGQGQEQQEAVKDRKARELPARATETEAEPTAPQEKRLANTDQLRRWADLDYSIFAGVEPQTDMKSNIAERVARFDKMLAGYSLMRSAEELLVDAKHWCDQNEIDFDILVKGSKQLHTDHLKEATADFLVTDYGSVWHFQAQTKEVLEFAQRELELEPRQWVGTKCFAVDRRPARALMSQLGEEGWRMDMPEQRQRMRTVEAKASERPKSSCSIDMGRFRAFLTGYWNEEVEVQTWMVEIYCDGKPLFAPLRKHELAGARRFAEDKGVDWLTGTLLARGVRERSATVQDLQDFVSVVQESEALIGRFAEHGAHRVLQELAADEREITNERSR